VDEAAPPPAVLALGPPVPNPFNPETRISFDLPAAGAAGLEAYDVRGRRVRTLWSGPLPAGRHRITWDGLSDTGQPVASGIYLLRLEAGGRVLAGRAVLLR
jgi:hypothetical protein